MIVNCGLFKTGSTGTYNIIRETLEFLDFGIGLGYIEDILDLTYRQIQNQNVVKTHIIDNTHIDFSKLMDCKFVCTYRDPRSSVASFNSLHGFVDNATYFLILKNWYSTYLTLLILDQSKVLFIKYSDLVNDFKNTIHTILKFIIPEFEFTNFFVDHIAFKTNPIRYKKVIVDKLINIDFDTTLLHPNHISDNLDLNGDKWKKLPIDIQITMHELFKDILIKYNFETESLFNILFDELKRRDNV